MASDKLKMMSNDVLAILIGRYCDDWLCNPQGQCFNWMGTVYLYTLLTNLWCCVKVVA